MTWLYFGYSIIAVCVLAILIKQLENKAFMGVILSWLLFYPILNRPEYRPTLHLGGFSFDLQPTRLLLLVLGAILAYRVMNNILKNKAVIQTEGWQQQWFNIPLIIYVGLTSLLVIIYSREVGGLGRATALATNPMAFLLVYFFAKRFCSPNDFKILVRVIWGLALFSMVVGVIQFFINPDFFQSGMTRVAFGSYTRGNGVFDNEYDQGLVAMVALVFGLYYLKNGFLRVIFTLFCGIAVLLTMHRLTWIILVIVLVVYFAQRTYLTPLRLATLTLGIAFVLSVVGFFPWQKLPTTMVDEFLYGRLQADTLSVRNDYNNLALYMIRKYPFGVGSFFSNVYQREAFLRGVIGNTPEWLEEPVVALVVHNGILAAGVKGGVFGMVCYGAYFFGVTLYFGRRALAKRRDQIIPFTIVLIYTLYTTTTQDFSDFSAQIPIFWALLVGYFLGNGAEASVKAVVSPVLSQNRG